jgi:RNA polymerase sigma-70 factor (ECF subfamily)
MATGHTSAMMALRDPDVRLMLRVRDADDRAAFAELVERYQHRVVGVLHHVIGHPDEADDLAQEVFLRVYRTREKYTPRAKFSTWLFTIANNLALNARRDRHRRPTVPLAPEAGAASGTLPANPVPDRGPAPGHRLQQEELATVVREALNELSDRQRFAVVLSKFEDMGYAEIADVMRLTPEAVKSLLSRARENLRARLQPYVDADGPTDD